MNFTLDHIAYLEREYLDQKKDIDEIANEESVAYPEAIHLVRIHGLARFWERHTGKIGSFRYLMEDLLAGHHSQRLPFVYALIGAPSAVRLFLGTGTLSSAASRTASASEHHSSTLITSLQSAYPGIDVEEQSPEQVQQLGNSLSELAYTGLVMGTPTIKVGTEEIGTEQVERLIRGLYGRRWAYLVVATPMEDLEVTALEHQGLDELRRITDAAVAARVQSPIAERYRKLLEGHLGKVAIGKTIGMWHTAAYILCENSQTFYHARGIVKAVFGGEQSLPDPVRVLPCHHLQQPASQFARLLIPPPPPPGRMRYAYKFQNTLNSKELGTYAHLPMEEMPEYFVKEYTRFHVASHFVGTADDPQGITIGEILDYERPMNYPYRIHVDDLKRHGLLAGVPGSGKTNTVFFLSKQFWARGTPFLIIEPAKTEYRSLLQSELGTDLQIFTLGDEMTSPFRLNPFEVEAGVPVQLHLDLLKSVFNASFPMYSPMQFVLEQCLHRIYEDKGWDLVTSGNERGAHLRAQPTLTDLFRVIAPIVDLLGYEPYVTMNIKAALETRVNNLRLGGKGQLLDTRTSIPMRTLLQRPTLLELENIGDDDDKSFLIGLLFGRLYEHYIAQGVQEGDHLRHVTIIEEAHRLFQNVPMTVNPEIANMKGKAVETFTKMLAEIRAYGESFLIVEQIPSKLAPDIIKNTNLKILHKLVAEEDRRLLGGTMNLTDEQEDRCASFRTGEAAVYGEHDDRAILVRVPYAKVPSLQFSKQEDHRRIRAAMQASIDSLTATETLSGLSSDGEAAWIWKKEAAGIVESREFKEVLARYILSVVLSASAVIDEFPLVRQTIDKLRKRNSARPSVVQWTLVLGTEDYFERKGREYGLTYDEVDELNRLFLLIVNNVVAPRDGQTTTHSRDFSAEDQALIAEFQHRYKALSQCQYYPYAGCAKVCTNNLCLYRYNIQPLLQDDRIEENFIKALNSPSEDDMWKNAWTACLSVTRRIMGSGTDVEERRKAALCFAIQKGETLPYLDAGHRESLVAEMLSHQS